MIDKEYIVCPFCKNKHSKNKAIGTSGLINYNGSELTIECNKCGKDFKCIYEVQIKFKTNKLC